MSAIVNVIRGDPEITGKSRRCSSSTRRGNSEAGNAKMYTVDDKSRKQMLIISFSDCAVFLPNVKLQEKSSV